MLLPPEKIRLGKCSELAPAYAGMASWQVGGGIGGRSFIPPCAGNAGGQLDGRNALELD
jgi:hypothetical protein